MKTAPDLDFRVHRLPLRAGGARPFGVGMIAMALLLAGWSVLAQTMDSREKSSSRAGDLENGKRVFALQGCDTCHGAAGAGGSAGMIGPRVSPPPASSSAFRSQVRNPRGQMPPYSQSKVSDTDLADVYAFLQAKKSSEPSAPVAEAPAGGNAQEGRALYMSYGCYECHGRYGEGSTATGPRLNPVPVSWAGFVSYLHRPSGNMPPYTDKVVSDSELTNIFAFLQSLPPPPKLDSIPLLK